MLPVTTSGCLEWPGSRLPNGYGRLKVRGRSMYAHRVAYEAHVGPIPQGLTIDHLCRNRACVNPEHLEAVTLRTNILRGEGGGARNRQKTHCPKGHAYAGPNLENRRCGRRRCRACGREWARAERRRRRDGRAEGTR